jgi:hypothetical protein
MPEKKYLISETHLTMLKTYLYGRPYAEVCEGVKILDALQVAPELPPPPEPPKE